MFHDAPESAMFAAEAVSVAGAVAERRREFASGRYCAREALLRIGICPGPVPADADGVPRWPAGVVGSITHCTGYRAAAVARSCGLRSVGIDAEPHAALPGDVLDLVSLDAERAELEALAAAGGGLHWDRILFSAKEAVYKAWYPLTRRWLEFTDVGVDVRPDGTFSARPSGPGPEPVDGTWTVRRGLVLTATAVRT
jgi:4'-phosphopantetheinyl transferase EntD